MKHIESTDDFLRRMGQREWTVGDLAANTGRTPGAAQAEVRRPVHEGLARPTSRHKNDFRTFRRVG